jgi:hypothetical protein
MTSLRKQRAHSREPTPANAPATPRNVREVGQAVPPASDYPLRSRLLLWLSGSVYRRIHAASSKETVNRFPTAKRACSIWSRREP